MRLKQYIRMITTIVLAYVLMASSVMASPDQCLKCHQNVLDNANSHIVVHKPISQNQCQICHITPQTNNIITEQIEQEQWSPTPDDNKWMEWLAESFTENSHQVALLPANACDTELTIKLWYQNRQKQQSTIRCPDFNTIPTKLSPPPKPTISQLHLDNYNDKLLSRATLSWITDVPCRCQLIYNFDNHQYVKKEDDFYTLNHNQEIRNFSPTDTSISILCDDTFQQRSQSNPISLTALTLKTHKPKDLQSPDATKYSTEFTRIANFVEITITTNQPAAISIGRIERKKEPQPTTQPGTTSYEPLSTATKDHPQLASKKQVNTTICFKCHRSTVEVSSHPINVVAPPGMIIPIEYPLLSGGKLSCMTCHSSHSNNNEARLIKSGKKELCTGCHTNY